MWGSLHRLASPKKRRYCRQSVSISSIQNAALNCANKVELRGLEPLGFAGKIPFELRKRPVDVVSEARDELGICLSVLRDVTALDRVTWCNCKCAKSHRARSLAVKRSAVSTRSCLVHRSEVRVGFGAVAYSATTRVPAADSSRSPSGPVSTMTDSVAPPAPPIRFPFATRSARI